MDAEVAGLHVVALTDRVGARLVRLEERDRLVVAVDEVGVVGGERVHELVDLLDLFARVTGHAPVPGALLGDPAVDEAASAAGSSGTTRTVPNPSTAASCTAVRERVVVFSGHVFLGE